jgi:hypothetical protein
MNLKITLSLVAVLAIAIAALLLTPGNESTTQKSGTTETAAADSEEKPVIPREALGSELNRITFNSARQDTVLKLERIDGRWWVTTPNQFPANAKQVDELLNQLSAMKGRGAKQNKPNGFVNDSPGVHLQHGNQETKVYLSKRLGAGRAILTVKYGDRMQGLNSSDALPELFGALNPNSYYGKAITPPLMPEIGRIEFNTPEGQSVLVQRDEQWWIGDDESPERALAQDVGDDPGIAQYFTLLQTIELIEVQDHDASPAAFGLENPVIRISMTGVDHTGDDNESLELKVGAPADLEDQTRFISINYGGQRKPAVFTVATEYALLLGQSAKAFRDPRIVTTPPSLIQTITLISDTPEKPDALIRLLPDRAELIIGPSGGSQPIDLVQLETALRKLSDTRSIDFVPMASQKQDLLVTVAIKPILNREVEVFEIRRDPDSDANTPTLLVRRGTERVALRVAEDEVAGLLDPESLVASPR